MNDALSDYGQAIELNENNADNYFNRGNVYLYQAGKINDPELFEKAH